MQQSYSKIGIMGGTFNPVHCGHLIVAEAVRESYSLDKVLFIPSGRPPHKSVDEVIDAEQRYEMVRLALSSNSYFEASRIEIDRKGYSYTVNTLQTLQELYGTAVKLYFIIGADIIPELATWKEYRSVFKLCEFIAVLRPEHGSDTFKADITKLNSDYGNIINIAEAPLVKISSSDIRERCSAGKSVKYLVPEEVEQYIKTEGLYKKYE